MICPICASSEGYTIFHPIDDDLSSTWQLSKGLIQLFDRREGYICKGCGANIRAQGLARAILESKYGFNAKTIDEWIDVANKKKLKVLELNACHELHKFLLKLTYLTYSEYGTKTEQNIENMTYTDASFDVVLHSETLEHVPNPRKAIDECRRVLKDDGILLFTTPIIWSRNTRRRADIAKGKVVKLLPASYHGKQAEDYLVYSEFGRDIDKLVGCSVVYADPPSQNYVFESRKQNNSRVVWWRKAMFYILEKTHERIEQ